MVDIMIISIEIVGIALCSMGIVIFPEQLLLHIVNLNLRSFI